MSTHTDKIRTALEECRNQIEVPGPTYPKVVAALAALAELEAHPQPAKALTDEEIERIIDSTETDLRIVHGDVRFDPNTFALECFRYARDNGYLAPAQPPAPTVEQIMNMVRDAEWDASDNSVDMGSNVFYDDLRARLTKLMQP